MIIRPLYRIDTVVNHADPRVKDVFSLASTRRYALVSYGIAGSRIYYVTNVWWLFVFSFHINLEFSV